MLMSPLLILEQIPGTKGLLVKSMMQAHAQDGRTAKPMCVAGTHAT